MTSSLKPSPRMPVRTGVLLLACLLLSQMFAACSDGGEVVVPDAPDASGQAEGTIAPAAGTYLLGRATVAQGSSQLVLDLVGANLVVDDATRTVSLDVSLHNSSGTPLFAPAVVWIGRFRPANVSLANADTTDDLGWAAKLETVQQLESGRGGIDYSATLGQDRALQPGETTSPRTWVFAVPDLATFSFGIAATFASESTWSVLSGRVFHDADGDGVRDVGEGAFTAGGVSLHRPDGVDLGTEVSDGLPFAFPVRQAGIHVLRYDPAPPPLDYVMDITTPNPLEILVLADATGAPISYFDADIGVRMRHVDPQLPPVVLTDLPAELIHQDPYRAMSFYIQSDSDVMSMTIQFDGCTDEHSFTAYVVGGFTDTNPIRANVILAHDAHGEHCSGTFERQLRFDLTPLRLEFERIYGHAGPLLVWFRDHSGVLTARLYSWGDAPAGNLLANGSFEAGGGASLDGWWVLDWSRAALVSQDSPDGSRFVLKLDTRTPTEIGEVIAPAGAVEGGDIVRLSGFLRAANQNGGGVLRMWTRHAGGLETWSSEQVVVTSTSWTEVTLQDTLAAAPGDTLWLGLASLFVEPGGAWGRTGYFDGFVVERLGP